MPDWPEHLGLSFREAVSSLLARSGLGDEFSLHLLDGGANNRIFRLKVDNGELLLKVYFRHPDDPRDRLGAEFLFSQFAWTNGLRCLPRAIACDPKNHLALYEFVKGRRLLSREVGAGFLRQALDFYQKLNRYKGLPGAQTLPKAAEACFSIAEHLQCVERRVQELCEVDDSSAINRQAARFIRNELSTAWSDVMDSVRKRAGELHLAVDIKIARDDRCLSPSDFGFHNAILACDDRLRFIDFEYAGWDDPAKMVCDFFCQEAVPVPEDYYDLFVETVVSGLSEPAMHHKRIQVLLPLYRLKWCCILMNEFLPVGLRRRRFARGTSDQADERKRHQLEKATHALEKLRCSLLKAGI